MKWSVLCIFNGWFSNRIPRDSSLPRSNRSQSWKPFFCALQVAKAFAGAGNTHGCHVLSTTYVRGINTVSFSNVRLGNQPWIDFAGVIWFVLFLLCEWKHRWHKAPSKESRSCCALQEDIALCGFCWSTLTAVGMHHLDTARTWSWYVSERTTQRWPWTYWHHMRHVNHGPCKRGYRCHWEGHSGSDFEFQFRVKMCTERPV